MDFIGAPYPIRSNSQGYFYSQKGLSQIKSDLLILLMTEPGERCMLPQYGTPLRSLLFEQNDETTAEKARQLIIDSINMWEPRVTIEQLEVKTGLDDEDLSIYNEFDNRYELAHILYVYIRFFDPEDQNEVDELVIELPLSGA